mmetsp:Transcript_22063/g.50997  ORF Transcript_22063/g.50997 Transcript_22063/m.50997 type:complete len:110 (-) Transcript_22063:13-342(-)
MTMDVQKFGGIGKMQKNVMQELECCQGGRPWQTSRTQASGKTWRNSRGSSVRERDSRLDRRGKRKRLLSCWRRCSLEGEGDILQTHCLGFRCLPGMDQWSGQQCTSEPT